MTKRRPRIFLSAAHRDRNFANRLANEIDRLGGQSYFAGPKLKPGEQWQETAEKELRSADLLVFVVPPIEGEGKLALSEIGAAKALGKPIFAIITDWEHTATANTNVATRLADNIIRDGRTRPLSEIAKSVLNIAMTGSQAA